MAKVTLIAGIMSLHGRLGDYCYRTYKNGNIVVSRMPQKSQKEPTAAQKHQQARFGSVVKMVNAVMRDPIQREVMEMQYKNQRRKNETLRGFVFRQINELYPS